MSQTLPRLRPGLDLFPSPVEERPGLLLRDPFNYAEQMLILPPLLAAGLDCFDGEQTILDLQAHLSRLTKQLVPQEPLIGLLNALRINGYLVSEEFMALRETRHKEFARKPTRTPAHAGSGYPDEANALRKTFDGYLQAGSSPSPSSLIGLAAPHVSPFGGVDCYAAAYNQLRAAKESVRNKTIILLGTSHYGQPERFGLTRKPFVTPYGRIEPDLKFINRLAQAAGESVMMEDYCHAIEHSLEFQAVFLQHVLGKEFKIVPILCGPFAKALHEGEAPERDDHVYRFFDALGELGVLHRDELFWVLGIDLAHIGRRYGDNIQARVNEGTMLDVAELDHARLTHACAGDAEEFFELVRPAGDQLKWCGFSPLYTFMQVLPEARGQVLKYDQWNIDEESVVSFAALGFNR